MVVVGMNHVLPVIAPRDGVVKPSFEFQSWFPRHRGKDSNRLSNIANRRPDTFSLPFPL